MYKLAIFDLDGTLVNSIEDIADTLNYALEQLGFPIHPVSEYYTFVGSGVVNLCKKALPYKSDYEALLSIYNEYYSTNYNKKTKPYAGIKELLNELKQKGITLAVASNKTHRFTVDVVNHCFGNNFFDIVIGKTEGTDVKPAPDILNKIIEKTGISKECAIMIGDTHTDIDTAKNAGISSIGCLWGFRDEEELKNAGADFIVKTPAEILSAMGL